MELLLLPMFLLAPLGAWVAAAEEAGAASPRVWRWARLFWIPVLVILGALLVVSFFQPVAFWGLLFAVVWGGLFLLGAGLIVLFDVKAAKRKLKQRSEAEERETQ